MEREIRAVVSRDSDRPRPARILPWGISLQDAEALLERLVRLPADRESSRVESTKAWRWGKPYESYAMASLSDIVGKIGAAGVVDVIKLPHDDRWGPAAFARFRSRGWRPKDRSMASAYERLAGLIDQGALDSLFL